MAAAISLAVPLVMTAAGGSATAVDDVCGPDRALPTLTAEYKASVKAALDSGPDLWGEELLARPEGPTYENMSGLLTPLMYNIQGRVAGPITATEVHYLPLGIPSALTSRPEVALHVADGSQIMTNRVTWRNMKIKVGDSGELYGSCLGALDGPRLFDGYQPILEVGYRDASGVTYEQESFAAHLPGTNQLASFVRITATPAAGAAEAMLSFEDFCGLNCHPEVVGNRLVLDGKTYLYFSEGATYDGTDVSFDLDLTAGPKTVYIVRVNAAAAAPELTADAATHDAARTSTVDYWNGRLAEGTQLGIPEQIASNAHKALVIQNLLHTWRYSLGNSYEAFYQPESNDTIEALGHLGYEDVYTSALTDLLPLTKALNRRNWEQGTKLYHAADNYWLTRDDTFLKTNLEKHKSYVQDFMNQTAAQENGLLERQQYSSDIKAGVYGLHQIGYAVRGVTSIAQVWRELGYTDLADWAGDYGAQLEETYRAAVRESQVDMADGSLFTPVMLLDDIAPWDPITSTLLGGYWNLVAHYGFAAGVYPAFSIEAQRTFDFISNHGGRLLGMLRARDSAVTNVYEVEQLKFLADNDLADQLVLSFYGKLAHGMTQNTFVSGEAHNVGPLQTKWPACRGLAGCVFPSVDEGWEPDEYYRGMYLAPNSANNTVYLEALRQMLVHQVVDSNDVPLGLNLGYATPRGWLEQGKTITVSEMPTAFGPVSYTMTSNVRHHTVNATVAVPSRTTPGRLSLRVRVPNGLKFANVLVDGRAHPAFDKAAQTIDLTGLTGTLDITVLLADSGSE